MKDFGPHAVLYDASVISEEEMIWRLIRLGRKHPDEIVVLIIESDGFGGDVWGDDKEEPKA